ncbi:hypothetical protein [Roseinatronobacter monicus]|uniref:YfdX protein n=1 Tax=Roseinatronobacter monicus TaxID=393481 RepID=A0A543KBF5_9RHOB|nr:hypothetical protein [Roseinatronobacter monicus]TQM92421.1 hypothetical protein BD293_1027 [Roseinatronobacter monicus]
MRFISITIFVISFVFSSVANAQDNNSSFDSSPVIDETIKNLESIRKLLEEVQTLDDNPGRFRRSSDDAQNDLNDKLDSLINLIVGESYAKARKNLLQSDGKISEIEQRIDNLRVQRLTAPSSEESKTRVDDVLRREFARGSREAIDLEISRLLEEMELLRVARADLEREFQELLISNYGIILTDDQVKSVLYQINGSSIVEAAVALSVLQHIENRLGEIRATVSNQDSLRRYYGVAAIMRLITVRLHERHLNDYQDVWIPALNSFESENDALINETRSLISQTRFAGPLELLQANLNIQLRVSEVANEYRALLRSRENFVAERLVASIADAEVAINTLRTLNQALIIFEQFSWNQSEFQALINIESNELIPLDEAELIDDFLSISRALAGT